MRGSALFPLLVSGITPLLVLAIVVVGVGVGFVAWRPPLLWSDQFGPTSGHNTVTSATFGPSGLYAIGTINYTKGVEQSGEVFVRKYDAGGSLVWNRMIPGSPYVGAYAVSTGVDGLYIAGRDGGNVSAWKYDFNGNAVWTREFATPLGGLGLPGLGISADSGGVYLAGSVHGSFTNQSFNGDNLFVREYDFGGNVLWTNEFSDYSGSIAGIFSDSSGVYVLTGVILMKYDLNGKQLWTANSGGTSLSGDTTGLYVSGSEGASLYFPGVGFVRKYDIGGNLKWTTHFSAPDNGGVGSSSISAGSSGIYLAMESSAANTWVMKYDSNGNQIWNFRIHVIPSELARLASIYSIAVGWQNLYVAGSEQVNGETRAVIDEFGPSSSLIFFGANPPFSFALAGALVSISVVGLLYFEKRRRRVAQRINSKQRTLTSPK